MLTLTPEEQQTGTDLLIKHLQYLIDTHPDISTFNEAFELFALQKFSLGNYATNQRVGASKDRGIDFYSKSDRKYHIGQCKLPAKDWLDSNPKRVREFGPSTSVIDDPRDALRYLLGQSQLKVNDKVKHLYSMIAADRDHPDFSLTYFLIVYGTLDPRTDESLRELQREYKAKNISIVLQDMYDLIGEFLVGAGKAHGDIDFTLRVPKEEILSAKDYCYLLANARDIYEAFIKYGWRLFDLNLRYEVQNSPINGEIVDSLERQKTRRQFHHFNNGLIIVANNYTVPREATHIRIKHGQVVNGLQTVKSIYNAVSLKRATVADLDADCVVQVKVIKANDKRLISQVVKATNNQNPMSARNLRANDDLQKRLRNDFSLYTPRWFFQTKQSEWDSLTQEGGHFFKDVVGFPVLEFKPDPMKKWGRVLDNQDAAKAYLAMIGFADVAGDRVQHFFGDNTIYQRAFGKCPSAEHWQALASTMDFDDSRDSGLVERQARASQYLFASLLWNYCRNFIPSPQQYREQALNEGVAAGKIKKASGEFTSSGQEQDSYLAGNETYQTWRLMANMKELLVETSTCLLVKRYGALEPTLCDALLLGREGSAFLHRSDIRDLAREAAASTDLEEELLLGRVFCFLRYCAAQFYEEKKKTLLSTSRIRTLLLERGIAADFKKLVFEQSERKSLDRAWKRAGVTFVESLPGLSKQAGASS